MTRPSQMVEEGVFAIPLTLPPSLEPQRQEFEQILLDAQRRVRSFALQHGWGEFIKQSFADRAEFFDDKDKFDRAVIRLTGSDLPLPLPKTFTAGLEQRVLIAVSPAMYLNAYPEGKEEKAFEKLLAHEIAHRLHVRVLGGNEDAMGPVWFFEDFAVYAAGQFEQALPEMSPEEIWRVTKAQGRGSYRQYAVVIRYFLSKIPLEKLVEMASHKDFIAQLKHGME